MGGDAGPDTDTPTDGGRLKKAPLVSKRKARRWHAEVTFCHLPPPTCCPAVVRCHFDSHSRTFQSHFISGWLREKHPVNMFSSELFSIFWWRKTFILSSRLTVVVFVFVQLKVNSFLSSIFLFLGGGGPGGWHCSYLSLKGRLSRERTSFVALFQHHLVLHLPCHTHSSLPGAE